MSGPGKLGDRRHWPIRIVLCLVGSALAAVGVIRFIDKGGGLDTIAVVIPGVLLTALGFSPDSAIKELRMAALAMIRREPDVDTRIPPSSTAGEKEDPPDPDIVTSRVPAVPFERLVAGLEKSASPESQLKAMRAVQEAENQLDEVGRRRLLDVLKHLKPQGASKQNRRQRDTEIQSLSASLKKRG